MYIAVERVRVFVINVLLLYCMLMAEGVNIDVLLATVAAIKALLTLESVS